METMKDWTAAEIRTLRKQLGMTQRDFAETLGVTQVYISYMEGGMKRPGKILKRLLDCMDRETKTKGG
jgi:DNA-binding transcriptional regulator YiaG